VILPPLVFPGQGIVCALFDMGLTSPKGRNIVCFKLAANDIKSTMKMLQTRNVVKSCQYLNSPKLSYCVYYYLYANGTFSTCSIEVQRCILPSTKELQGILQGILTEGEGSVRLTSLC